MLLPMVPLILAICWVRRLTSSTAEVRPLLTSLLRLSICPLSCLKRVASELPLSSMLCRSAVDEALDETALVESKKFDHSPATLVAVLEYRLSTRLDSEDSCCRRDSSPPLSSRREVASWSATRLTSVILAPLPTNA